MMFQRKTTDVVYRQKEDIRRCLNEIQSIVQQATADSAEQDSRKELFLGSSLNIISLYLDNSDTLAVDLCFALIANQYKQLLESAPVQAEAFFDRFVFFVDGHGSAELAECLHRYAVLRENAGKNREQIQLLFDQEVIKPQPDWVKIELLLKQEPTLDVNIMVDGKPLFMHLVYKYIENGTLDDSKIILALSQAESLRKDLSTIFDFLAQKMEMLAVKKASADATLYHDEYVLEERRIFNLLHLIQPPAHPRRDPCSRSECDPQSIVDHFFNYEEIEKQVGFSPRP